jgi:hypothetical protein
MAPFSNGWELSGSTLQYIDVDNGIVELRQVFCCISIFNMEYLAFIGHDLVDCTLTLLTSGKTLTGLYAQGANVNGHTIGFFSFDEEQVKDIVKYLASPDARVLAPCITYNGYYRRLYVKQIPYELLGKAGLLVL